MSSNGSSIGYRGSHRIPNSDVDFIYQVSTSINMAAAPGLQDTWTKSSNTVQGAIGLGDTFLGFKDHTWGTVKFGEMYMPYKTSTDRLNPFGTGLGNYAAIMGNSGGDNRVEFGTRGDDVVFYSSPTWAGFSFDAAYQFGQQLDPNSDLTPLGSPDCNGSNNPGSGNLFLNCDDGGYDRAYSADLKFAMGGLYLVGAYEIHKRVNRSSDGIGANSPYYNYLVGQGNGVSPLLDWADYNAYATEYPTAATAGTPAYSTQYDVADEWAMKFGVQYAFDFGLTRQLPVRGVASRSPGRDGVPERAAAQRDVVLTAAVLLGWPGCRRGRLGARGSHGGGSGRAAQLQPDQHRQPGQYVHFPVVA